MRQCYKCKQMRDESAFSDNSSRKDKLQVWCKCCQKEYNEKWLIRRKEINHKHYLERGKIMYDLKANGCAICGYNKCNRALTFHHANPIDKTIQITVSNMGLKPKRIADEINKCILLCFNCHMEIENR